MLRLEGVSAGYGRISALAGVDVEVLAGEFVCLVGANGAGKTTTLKTISGLVRPTAGRILFEGQEIHGLAPQEILRRGIAHCPEGRRIFPYMTVQENLEMGAFVRDDDIGETLEQVFTLFPALREKRHQPAGELSGGQRQQVAVGRALMTRPKLLMLDEPTAGVSPIVMDDLFDRILEIAKTGIAILMVEQNARQALEIADHGFVMVQGQNRFTDTGTALLANPEVRRSFLGG